MDGRGENPLNLILVVFALFLRDVTNYGLIRKLSLRRVLCWCLNVLFLMTFLWLTRLKNVRSQIKFNALFLVLFKCIFIVRLL